MKALITLVLLISFSTQAVEDRKMVWYYKDGTLKTETHFTPTWLVNSFKHNNADGSLFFEVDYDSIFDKHNYLDITDPAWELKKKIGTMPLGGGQGDFVRRGKRYKVHYICFSKTGEQFDNSFKRNMPLDFVIGAPGMLLSFSRGLTEFKPGQYGFLYLPSYLAYGDEQVANVPPNSDLYYFIQVLPQE